MINRREVMAPVVDIRWWKLPYLEMRTYGSKWRKTISPPAWWVGGLLFHYRPEGGLSVVVHVCARETETWGMWVWGQPGLDGQWNLVFFSCCCENTLTKATSRRKGLFSLVAPGYSPSWWSSQGGQSLKQLSPHIRSRSRGEWMPAAPLPCLQLYSPRSPAGHDATHSGWTFPSRLTQLS